VEAKAKQLSFSINEEVVLPRFAKKNNKKHKIQPFIAFLNKEVLLAQFLRRIPIHIWGGKGNCSDGRGWRCFRRGC